jgi:hypothetical protein
VNVDATEFRRLQDHLGQTERAFRAALPALLNASSDILKQRIGDDFDTKASGGTGADGTQWAPLTAAYASTKTAQRLRRQIGLRTGELRESLTTLGNTGETRVGFAAAHANLFDERRPLIPTPLPRSWMREIERHAETQLGKLLADSLR